jgi:hypothetical protein
MEVFTPEEIGLLELYGTRRGRLIDDLFLYTVINYLEQKYPKVLVIIPNSIIINKFKDNTIKNAISLENFKLMSGGPYIESVDSYEVLKNSKFLDWGFAEFKKGYKLWATFVDINLWPEGEKISIRHVILLIWDGKTTAYVFDPLGTKDMKEYINQLKKIFPNWNILNAEQSCPRLGPQMLEYKALDKPELFLKSIKTKKPFPEAYCVIWAIMFLEKLMQDPTKSSIKINEEMMEVSGPKPEIQILNRIRRYTLNLFKKINFIKIVKDANEMQSQKR